MRGLKQVLRLLVLPIYGSHPSWVRGLKLLHDSVFVYNVGSHPSWVRGLKLRDRHPHADGGRSHPSWVRGLKLVGGGHVEALQGVAPLVGAWIETVAFVS